MVHSSFLCPETPPTHEEICELLAKIEMPVTEEAVQKFSEVFTMTPRENMRRILEAHDGLANIQRFRGIRMNKRDTVGMHVARLRMLKNCAQHSIHLTFPEFDFQKLDYILHRHDTPEGMTTLGDIPTSLKLKLSPAMREVLAKYDRACYRLIAGIPDTRVIGSHPELLHPHNEQERCDIFEAYEKREEPWAQIAKYFDIVDAYMETLLESRDYNHPEFIPICERYRQTIRTIVNGTYLPAIKKIFDTKETIRAWLHETFGDEDSLCDDIDKERFQTFWGAFSFFDFDSLVLQYPKAFYYWKKRIFPVQAERQILVQKQNIYSSMGKNS